MERGTPTNCDTRHQKSAPEEQEPLQQTVLEPAAQDAATAQKKGPRETAWYAAEQRQTIVTPRRRPGDAKPLAPNTLIKMQGLKVGGCRHALGCVEEHKRGQSVKSHNPHPKPHAEVNQRLRETIELGARPTDMDTGTRPERNSSSLLLLLRLQRADQQEGEGARVDCLIGSGRQRTVRSLLCGPEGLTSCSGRIPVLARCAAVATLSLKRCGGWPPVLQRRSVAHVDTRAEPSLLPHGGTKGAIEISDVDR